MRTTTVDKRSGVAVQVGDQEILICHDLGEYDPAGVRIVFKGDYTLKQTFLAHSVQTVIKVKFKEGGLHGDQTEDG